ncbi:MAG: Uma2 family endonuclease [Actinomycetota bacterium]|nr:Uma2 family endonuclease [Actinomycetota bacterium]
MLDRLASRPVALRSGGSLTGPMRTLLPDPPPAGFEALLERRRQWGADHHDEVWEGVLHMNPAPHLRHADVQAQLLYLVRAAAHSAGLRVTADFNLGEPGDYRVPNGGLHHPGEAQLYCTTAALVVEVLSQGDETWNKLPFYADHQVDEVLIVDPDARQVSWLVLERGEYQLVRRSSLLELDVGELAQQIDWPD